MKRNGKFWGLVAGVAALALLVGGTAVASNMGFKFVPSIGSNEFFNLSLPWNNNYNKANELFNDLGASVLTKFNADGSVVDWNAGAQPFSNYDIIAQEAYLVQAAGAIESSVIVGSHDPNATVSIAGNEFFNYSHPYHSTLTKANELFNDFNSSSASAVSVITKYNADGTVTDWNAGAQPFANFDLTLGMGVLVQAGDGLSGYVAPHY
jgi:hypothetical protein